MTTPTTAEQMDIEAVARCVYEAMRVAASPFVETPRWTEGGNSTRQDEARRAAARIVALVGDNAALSDARATIARLEASNRDLEAAVHTYRKIADAAKETIARLATRPEMLVIPASSGLDQVRVFFVDHEPGKGTLVISCYGEAWSCYFGAMGKRTLRQFVASVSRDYLGNAMRVGNAHYRERIANAVILACRDAVAAASGDTATAEG